MRLKVAGCINRLMYVVFVLVFSYSPFALSQNNSTSGVDVEGEFYKELRLLNNLQEYNEQLQLQINSQEKSKLKVGESIASVKLMEREFIPLLVRMFDTLKLFVRSDIPFDDEGRKQGLLQVEEALNSNVLLSELYRQFFSLYSIENEYGRSYQAYTGSLVQNEKLLTVDYLRVGRLGYYYLTKDGSMAGMWNKKESKWVALPKKYNRHIRKSIRVASKTIAPELINLPLIAPEGI